MSGMSLNNFGKKSSEAYSKGGSLASVSHVKGSPSPDRRPGSGFQKSQTPFATGILADAQHAHRLGSASSIQSRSPKTERQQNSNSARKTPNILPVGLISMERHIKKSVGAVTDSEESEEDSSIGVDHSGRVQAIDPKSGPGGINQRRIPNDEWQVLEGLRSGQQCEEVPTRFSGFILKSRKWPMKGWHKRFFMLENGILTYAKSMSDLEKGKFHGSMDTGLSVIVYKRKGRRIDVDADDLIYHLKTKTTKQFEEWIAQFRHHRLYRQHEISFGTKDAPRLVDVTTPINDYSPLMSPLSPASPIVSAFARGDSFKRHSLERTQSRVTAWLIDSHGMEAWNKELTATQAKIFELGTVLDHLHNSTQAVASSWTNVAEDFGSTTSSSKRDKSNKRYFLNKPSAKKDRRSKGRLSAPNGMLSFHTSSSNPNLSINAETNSSPMLNDMVRSMGDHDRLHEQFCDQAKHVHDALKGICHMMTTERERLKRALEYENSPAASQSSANFVQSLRQTLNEVVKQNAELKKRLTHIHAESSISDSKTLLSPLILPGTPSERVDNAGLVTSVSLDSQAEFYDAPEHLDSSFTDESEEEDEEDEETSDTENTTVATSENDESQFSRFQTRRRSKLPVPRVESDVSLWSLLCKNIGKDLSKISMPVSVNEPLNALQRLCEELEYSELIDRAVDINDPFERMVLIATFSVSAYAATYSRAGQKPFNPLLGETYECIREDKGWKFLAEQVSHHPPVAACVCDSKNFLFWQDMQVKTKFWGKSMEILPVGLVHLKLPKFKEHYTWNKATSCVHNILGGQRWIDYYGEVMVVNHTLNVTCKLTYVQSSYWSSKKHEVFGGIQNTDGTTVHHIFGRWNEGLYSGNSQSAKCIWRPGALPPDSDIYYGFTRFAIELNEIDSEQVHLYSPTDTRFRPDQRLLEEGKLLEADQEKQRLEQLQREQRKKREEEQAPYSPRWFTKQKVDGKESFVYSGKYWETRKDPGFLKLQLPRLW